MAKPSNARRSERPATTIVKQPDKHSSFFPPGGHAPPFPARQKSRRPDPGGKMPSSTAGGDARRYTVVLSGCIHPPRGEATFEQISI
jgi:hypothetical protein